MADESGTSRGVLSAVLVTVAAIGGFIYTLAVGNEPLLGIDLQGGISVLYQPAEDAGEPTEEALDQAVDIIRNRVDAIGVAEPEIARQGSNISVSLPGVEDRERVLNLVGQTAELRFRPVLADLPSGVLPAECQSGEVTPPEEDENDAIVVLADTDGLRRYCLGTTLLTGTAVETASAGLGGQLVSAWQVLPVFKGGAEGIDLFNAAAAECFNATAVCPPTTSDNSGRGIGRLAIVLDGEVISAPAINAPSFGADQIVISGAFEEETANDLATALRFGSLPVQLEAQDTRTVSAAVGTDVLRAGVTAGLVGLGLVSIYLLAYYRLAGVVALLGLVFSGLLLWTIIAFIGETQGLALTLSGVVGLIVAIGVSADSNIVYFENVKDAYAEGRRVPTAVERAYESAISTIFKADFVSLIAAALLYFLTVGAVRGFALYLGLATILDLVISVAFMRPALAWIAGRPAVQEKPSLIGMPGGAS